VKYRSLILVAAVVSVLTNVQTWAASPANDKVIPLIEMESVLLTDAIWQLARQAHLNILLDPRLSEPPLARMTVSIRWQNVTAKEALVALLDNYGLALVEAGRPAPSR